jgi:L-lactate permease
MRPALVGGIAHGRSHISTIVLNLIYAYNVGGHSGQMAVFE